MWSEQIIHSGRKNDAERHCDALKRGTIFSAMGMKVFFNPYVELRPALDRGLPAGIE